jgi:plasmid stabilization system protein ParE
MASPELTLTVVLSPTAIDELHAIWLWNAVRYSTRHADEYVRYLKGQIDELARRYSHGTPVSSRPDLRYIVIRRKPKGHAHLAAYRVAGNAVNVLHVFHSARDWQAKLTGEKPNH